MPAAAGAVGGLLLTVRGGGAWGEQANSLYQKDMI